MTGSEDSDFDDIEDDVIVPDVEDVVDFESSISLETETLKLKQTMAIAITWQKMDENSDKSTIWVSVIPTRTIKGYTRIETKKRNKLSKC